MDMKNRLIDLVEETHKIMHDFVNSLSEAERNTVGTRVAMQRGGEGTKYLLGDHLGRVSCIRKSNKNRT